MYKVMIVEDEIPIRNIISRIIDWDELGFDLVYQADNGQVALAYLEANNVDLIITDISMPFMDGLELCQHIRRLKPSTTIMILTGHNEFEYAQKAIHLNVSNYLLKPITKKGFQATLLDIKTKMDEKYATQRDFNFLSQQYHKSKDVLMNKYFINLMLGYSQPYYLDENEILEVSLIAPWYRVGVMEIEDQQIQDSEFWGKDRPLLEFAIFNLSKELLETVQQDIIFLGQGNQICMIFKLENDFEDEPLNQIILILEDMSQQIEKLFKMRATIGISDPYNNLPDLSIAYKEANVAIEYKVLEGSERVILKSTVENKSSFTFSKIEEQLTRLEYAIKVGDDQTVKKIITYVFSVINYDKIDINEFRTFLLRMIMSIFKAYNDSRSNDDVEVVLDYTMFSRVFEINDFLEIQKYFMQICSELTNRIQSIRANEEQNHVKEACDYIRNNYQDPLLSLEGLCQVLYLSPGHFSRLFKKTKKLNFVDYLTQVRMDQAKYLLANTNQKMYEIANAIGYEDPNYFSYNFKKHVQMTPSEWRKVGGTYNERS